MGAYWSKRIGSDPYYASYERSFKVLKKDIDRIKISLHRRKYREHVVANTIFFYGAVGFGLALLGAAWVVQQPTGTYTPQGHSMRVAPLFAEPVLAYLLYYIVLGAMHLWDNRDKRRVEVLNKKLRKMVAELKDSTRYEKTAKLLESYDPDYVPPTPRKQQQQQALRTAYIPGSAKAPSTPAAGRGDRRLSLGPLQHMTGAGISLMPAFDKLATSLIGDNPALTEALRAARGEAEGWKSRTLQAEAQIVDLRLQLNDYRMQLGLPVLGADDANAPPGAPPWHKSDEHTDIAGALAAITAISNSAADSSLPPGAAGEQQQEANVKPIVVEADASEEVSKVGRQEQEEGIGQGPAINIHEEIN
ncbi:hypothetical protein CVIRNUC_001426 [Coccomyxa viridis]|uniref:Uncharacterized protein n=1 Tax=Coccomyxa viridis TaxID=1274662 RepID=A0AAV1HW28_9CHLO|nr:hypothetical protein CVIRNUC_001426 [Coccomyxa viridis]